MSVALATAAARAQSAPPGVHVSVSVGGSAPSARDAPPVDRQAFFSPAPGRVPLVIESTGPALALGAHLSPDGGTDESAPFHDLCLTPCRLYVRPGLFSVGARAGSGSDFRDFNVPATGLHVQMRPSDSKAIIGGALLVGFSLVAGLGAEGLFLGAGSTSDGRWLMATGIGAIAASAVGVALSVWLFVRAAPAVHSTALPARLAFAPTLVPGGAGAVAALRF